ncbi:MAG: response regulator [Opitutales bacterium]|nr:response regulator [Opitutales bacterium]
MPDIHILCIEDEPDVLDAVLRDLAPFEEKFTLTGAADAAEAREILEGLDPENDAVGLIFCDHIMPGQRGIELLIALKKENLQPLEYTRKVLFTGQADHADTIQAINEAGIDHYLAKPWEADELRGLARKLLTEFVIAARIPPLPYMAVLDGARLAEVIHDRNDLNETG